MVKRKYMFSFMLVLAILLSGCGDKNLTLLYFESYDELQNPKEDYHSGDEYIFEVDGKRYKVMHGYLAEQLKLIEEKEDNRYKILITDGDLNQLFSMITKREYAIEAIRECSDTNGKVYILYSNWDSDIGNLFLEELKSTHVLELDMQQMEIKKEYEFGESILVLSIHDGYAYTMEDGRVYRELLDKSGKKECMADLGFRGMPDIIEMEKLSFYKEAYGIKIVKAVRDKENYSFRNVIIADIKYTDEPIETDESR